jgi:hypothetical protein
MLVGSVLIFPLLIPVFIFLHRHVRVEPLKHAFVNREPSTKPKLPWMIRRVSVYLVLWLQFLLDGYHKCVFQLLDTCLEM